VAKFKCRNCGDCCGPIPITEDELNRIKTALSEIEPAEIDRVKAQERGDLTCILRDTENKRCLVYRVRPFLCREFGHVSGMKCPQNPRVPFKSRFLAYKELEKNGEMIGILSQTIGWGSLEGGESNVGCT